MEQTVRAFDQQYLEKTTADLLVLKAEIQKLKGLIRAAAKRSRGVRRTSFYLDAEFNRFLHRRGAWSWVSPPCTFGDYR